MRQTLVKNVQYILFYLFFCGAEAFLYPYLSLYFDGKGLSAAQTGTINAASFVVTILAGILLGQAADRSGHAKGVLLLSLLGVALSVLGLSFANSFWTLCMASMAYTFLYVPCGDIADKMLLDRLEATKSAGLFSIFRFGGPLGYCLGVLVAGALAVRFSMHFVFLAGILAVGLSALAVLPMRVQEGRVAADSGKRAPLKHVAGNPKAPYLYSMLLFWGFVESGALPFITVYMAGAGRSADFSAMIIAIAMVGQIAGYLFLHRVLRHVNSWSSMALGFCLMGLRIVTLAFASVLPAALLVLLQFVGGLSQPFVLACVTGLLGREFAASGGNTAQTLKTVANRGVGGSIGTLLFGWLYTIWSPQKTMALFGILCFVFAIVSIGWGKHVLRQRQPAVQLTKGK